MSIYKLIIALCLLITTASAVPSNTSYDFDKNLDQLLVSNLSVSNMTSVGAAPYTDIFGQVFWGIVFAALFIMMGIRQEDITIPSLLGLIIGASIWTLMPQDWVAMATGIMVISLAGLVYSMLKK